MRDVNALHPLLQEKIEKVLSLCEKQGLRIGIGECVRTVKEQDELYAKGRTKPGSVVTNAKGSTYLSMHQWGVAFDFYRNDGTGAYNNQDNFFEKVGKIGQSIGLIWGGAWKSPKDMPHFQLSCWGKTASALKKQYGRPENFMKTWEEEAMTKEEREKFELLTERVDELTKRLDEVSKDRIYHYTKELPEWARPTIQKLLDKGLYKGASESDLNLPESMMRTLVILERIGIYDGRP